jgi:hypothetical protein
MGLAQAATVLWILARRKTAEQFHAKSLDEVRIPN